MRRVPDRLLGERLPLNVKAKRSVFLRHQLGGHPVVFSARDTAPILFAVLLALKRDGGDLLDHLLDAIAVDVLVRLLPRQQRKDRIVPILRHEFVHVARQAQSVCALDLSASPNILSKRVRCCAGE